MARVSDIAVYLRCPRMLYFVMKGHNLIQDINPSYLERILLKELALSYAQALKQDDRQSFLNEELDRISQDVPVIYRSELAGIDAVELSDAVSGVRSFLGEICENLAENSGFYTSTTFQVGPMLQSEKYRLSGSPDKVMTMNGGFLPSILKTGNRPENGVWKTDRLQLTAYAILMEETYDSLVERGYVEYARWGIVREAALKREDRRRVLRIVEKINKIKQGVMPEKPDAAHCEYCGFHEQCEVKPTLASRFF